ncbi:thioredoxin family protein [Oenococcus alcoholitolerans]|uniref:Thiol-disulfide isomerase n=1 Tax=Oenococcus alcoholitolerans TaxID=931074 RepID=A0ABR4XSB1_9LACO|nr:thiol-disulfide isomerase [Oenococcus alcoholitolerans]
MKLYQPESNSDQEVKEKIQSEGRTVMFLQAAWCGDCKAIKPFVSDIKEEVAKSSDWVDADRDANIDVAKEQGLRGIPAFVLFKNGKQISHIGDGQRLTPKEVLDWYRSTLD